MARAAAGVAQSISEKVKVEPLPTSLVTNFAAVQFDEFAGQRETKTRALGFGGRPLAHLAKLLEHRSAVFGGDPDTRVGDTNLDPAGNRFRAHRDPSAVGRELHRDYGVERRRTLFR
jgi:hypothetical protein